MTRCSTAPATARRASRRCSTRRSARADAFAAAHAGKVAELDGPALAAAMRELAALQELVGRAGSYAMLRFATATADPERGALMQKVQERGTQIETELLFFELEWAALDDDRAEELLAHDGLDFCRHHLRTARRYRPHLLSEPEERILAEKALTVEQRLVAPVRGAGGGDRGRRCPARTSPSRSRSRSRASSPPTATSAARPPRRSPRRSSPGCACAATCSTRCWRRRWSTTACAPTRTGSPAATSPTRRPTSPSQALVEAVRGRYELPRRWYRLKARLLGLDRLADYDRMAAVTDEDEPIPWARAKDIVLDSFDGFSPELAASARAFFDEQRIDAPVRPGKRGGAFCSYTVPSAAPYVMLNYTARRRDVLTLAHELGHGVHASLARPQGVYHFATPLTLAETASVFGETLVFGRLLDEAPTPASRLGLLAESIEGSIATVFRQVAMNRFEHLAHTARREQGELSLERIGELWAESQEELLGDAVEVTEGYRSWWSYVPHFINSPGYVYAYAYGQLLALAVYGRYEEEGEAFVPAYLELLAAGGSMPPEELGRIVGIDLADPGFWDRGLDLVERQLEAAEAAAREAGRV